MQYLHETRLMDLIDMVDAIVSNDAEFLKNKMKNKDYTTSINAKSKDLVMTFPVLCSNTIDIKTATMISKANERKCVGLLQMLFTSQWMTSADNASDFIANFHTNLANSAFGGPSDMTVDDIIGLTGDIDALSKLDFKEDARVLSIINAETKKALNERVLSVDPCAPVSLQEYRVSPTVDGDKVTFHPFRKTVTEAESLKDITTYFTKQLLDSDVKKVNELVPSLLIINFQGKIECTDGDEKCEPVKLQAIIGVKSRLVPVDSFDIIDRIFVKHNDKNIILKLVRATTREISFVKDFLLGIKKAKVDAVAQSRKGSSSRIWKTLERRSTQSKMNKALRRRNDASAITTLVISSEEADYLKKNYNINVMEMKTALTLLEAYNLLAFVVVDENTECAHFLYDGDNSFETLSFNNLEREGNDGGMYKKVINMMSKMM